MSMERPRNIEHGKAGLTVEPAGRKDMSELIEIVGDPEDLEYMMEMQEKGEGTYFIAKEDEKIVGAVLLERNYQSKYKSEVKGNFFAGMIVSEEARGKGVGSKLLSACESEVKAMGGDSLQLAVSKENDRAIGFYEKHGFVKIPDSDYVVTDEGGEGGEGEENFYMIKEFSQED